ncbi:MAG: type II-A CRISPR-associated protein Csn2 [Limosilactobacillus sp.]
MILSYKGHKAVSINPGKVTVIGTDNPTVFTEILNGLQGCNDFLTLVDDSYNQLEIDKFIDFDSEQLLTYKLYEKYSKKIISSLVKNIPFDSQSKINNEVRKLYSTIQEALFMTDLPIEIDYDGDLKRLLNYCHPKESLIDKTSPYDIIVNDLKIHLECNLKSITCFSNVANYLRQEDFCELLSEVQLLNISLLLVEFTEKSKRQFYKNADLLFIDQDFVDWKL